MNLVKPSADGARFVADKARGDLLALAIGDSCVAPATKFVAFLATSFGERAHRVCVRPIDQIGAFGRR